MSSPGHQPPLIPRPAATVMLVRDAEPGLEAGISVFLMRRHSRMQFAPGTMVFRTQIAAWRERKQQPQRQKREAQSADSSKRHCLVLPPATEEQRL